MPSCQCSHGGPVGFRRVWNRCQQGAGVVGGRGIQQLAGIACPTLLLCGRQDAWSPLERHEEMAGLIPGSRLEVIEEAGHMSPMERPAAVARALDHWRNHA